MGSIPADDGGDLPLGLGSSGEPVIDLQQRLRALGFDVDAAELGRYGGSTAGAVERFQSRYGLLPDGSCDTVTWQALVEAGLRLGDRLLYLRSPMLRGDDVADLQARMGSLGFDAGRIDGIFGPDTERALRDFQRNVGVTIDGVFGPDGLAALRRLGRRPTDATPVARVRELEGLRSARRVLAGTRVVVGQVGGLDALAAATARALGERGAVVMTVHHPDGSTQAAEANGFDAAAYIGLMPEQLPTCAVAHYRTDGFESVGGRRLGHLVVSQLGAVDGLGPSDHAGLRLPVLRETRMPAVLCRIGPPDVVVRQTAVLARAIASAAASWVAEPFSDAPDGVRPPPSP